MSCWQLVSKRPGQAFPPLDHQGLQPSMSAVLVNNHHPAYEESPYFQQAHKRMSFSRHLRVAPRGIRRPKNHIITARAMRNAHSSPTPTPIPTFACSDNSVLLLESGTPPELRWAIRYVRQSVSMRKKGRLLSCHLVLC